MSENPLVAMLQMQAERARRRPVGPGLLAWTRARTWRTVLAANLFFFVFFVSLLGFVPVLLGALHSPTYLLDVSYGVFFFLVWCTTLGLWLGLPARRLASDTSLLVMLKQGRGLVELQGTGWRPAQLLDGLAWHIARSAVKEGAQYLIPLGICQLAAGAGLPGTLFALAAWGPTTFLLVGATAYSSIAAGLWGSQNASLIGQLANLVRLLLVAPACGFIVFFWGVITLKGRQIPDGLLIYCGCLGLYVAFHLVCSRTLALASLDRLPRLQEKVETASKGWLARRRNRWMRPWSDNAIEVRECSREALRTPGGFLGYLVLRLPALWIILFWCAPVWTAVHANGSLDREFYAFLYWSSVVLLALAQLRMTVGRTSSAIVGEHEQATLEVLRQSRLSASDFYWGWLRVGCIPRYLELAFLTPILVWLGIQADVSVLTQGLTMMVLVMAVFYGACTGLWASWASNRRSVSQRISNAISILFFGIFLAWVTGIPMVIALPWLLGSGSLVCFQILRTGVTHN